MYLHYKNIGVKNNLTGQEAAKKILDANNIDNINIISSSGFLTDYYSIK